MNEIKKSGIISIVGRPNVGKSTLTNALVGDKVAIVTNKPQTTRNRITGVVTRGECQFVLLDTPGLHKARTRLGDYMVNVVRQSVADVDAIVLVVEPIANIGTISEPATSSYSPLHTLTDGTQAAHWEISKASPSAFSLLMSTKTISEQTP